MQVISQARSVRLFLGFLGGCALATSSFASNADINFAGFASLVYGKTISDDKKEESLYGLSNEGEFRDFNKLGFRMNADMKNNLSFTAQLLATGADDYDPAFDWIFATYQLHPELAVSFGRIRVPVFMYSDVLDTSYAYQWIEPPKTVYNLSQTPFKSIEGVKLAYTTNMADWTSEVLVWGGKGSDKFQQSFIDDELELDNALGLAWTVGYDWLSMRAFYFKANTSLDLETNAQIGGLISGDSKGEVDPNLFLVDGVSKVPPGLPSIKTLSSLIAASSGGALKPNFTDSLLMEKDAGRFFGVGTSMDFEHFFIIAEATRIETENGDANLVTPRLDSYYITGGVRLPAQVTLSLTYGQDKDYANKQTWEQFDATIAALAADPATQGALLGLQSLVKAVTLKSQDFQSQETTLSARWDFHPSASAKVEYICDEREGQYVGGKTLKPEAIRIGLDFVF